MKSSEVTLHPTAHNLPPPVTLIFVEGLNSLPSCNQGEMAWGSGIEYFSQNPKIGNFKAH